MPEERNDDDIQDEEPPPPSLKALGKRRALDEGPGVKSLSPHKNTGSLEVSAAKIKKNKKRVEREEIEEVEEVEPRKKKKRLLGGGFGLSSSSLGNGNWNSVSFSAKTF